MTEQGEVVDEVPVDPARSRVYAEGWQSWSPATWYPVAANGRVPDEEWQHLMRFRPGTPLTPHALQAEGLLVVDPATVSRRGAMPRWSRWTCRPCGPAMREAPSWCAPPGR